MKVNGVWGCQATKLLNKHHKKVSLKCDDTHALYPNCSKAMISACMSHKELSYQILVTKNTFLGEWFLSLNTEC